MRRLDAAERSVEVLGDRWTLRILSEVFEGRRRFEAFRTRLGIARNILSSRLRRMVEQEILERRRYQSRPARYEYVLTKKGADLYWVITLLGRWGERWITHEAPTLVHGRCGGVMEPTFVCPECHERIKPGDLQEL